MQRRDTERIHNFSNLIFNKLNIFDLQGVLKEGEVLNCGIESYQVKSFQLINFKTLNHNQELGRYLFCKNLSMPYYVIIVSEESFRYRIYETELVLNKCRYHLKSDFNKIEFLDWWRTNQSFTQKKQMYNAKSRIKNSIIDNDLFSNSLAWGVNIDGFTLDKETKEISAIIEKRICTYKPPYSVETYDPNRFFNGTRNRSGDYPSWKILFELSEKLNSPLILITFDTSNSNKLGGSKIIDVSRFGLKYNNQSKPYQNIFNKGIENIYSWYSRML